MRERISGAARARPSPAMIVAVLALVAGLTGAAAAPVSNKGVSKGKAKKIADKEITKKAPGLSVAHAGSADSATNATNANNAATVNNVGVSEINYSRTPVTGNETIFTGSGLTLQAACAASADISITATTSKNDSSIYTSVVDTDTNNNNLNSDRESGAFDVNDNFDLLATNNGNPSLITFEYDSNDGSTVSGAIAVDEVGAASCQAHGHVLHS